MKFTSLYFRQSYALYIYSQVLLIKPKIYLLTYYVYLKKYIINFTKKNFIQILRNF